MYEGIYLVFIRSLIFFNIKYEYNITLKTPPALLIIIIMFSRCRGGFILQIQVSQSSFNYT